MKLKINFMKKLSYLMLGLVATGMLFTSCEDDTDAVGPSITVTTSASSIGAGEAVTFAWTAVAGDANVESLEVRYDNLTVYEEEDVDKDTETGTWDTTLTVAGEYDFTFVATDKDGETGSKTVTITVTSDLVSLGSETLGAGGSSLGSYYSVSEDAVYLFADAQTNADKVDIVFTSDASEAKLFSPDDATSIGSSRTTKYEVVDLDFDTVLGSDLDAVSPSDAEVVILQGDVVVFETDDNVKGIIEVTSLAVADDGTVSIDIQVKQ